MKLRDFRKVGHWPSLFCAFLYFDTSFMIWVLIGALAVSISADFWPKPDGVSVEEHLRQIAPLKNLMLAVPLLGGSILRLVLGLLTDRIGARRTGLIGMTLTAVPLLLAWLWVDSLPQMLLVGLMLGVAGASFAAALPLASRWYPPQYQGLAMGIAGAGNSGTALATFFGPMMALHIGWHAVFAIALAPLAVTLILFFFLAKDSPNQPAPKPLFDYVKVLSQADAWWFCLFYSVTFGGFVGLSSFLNTFFKDQYFPNDPKMGAVYAGYFTTLCVVSGSFLRPVGGYLADRFGGVPMLLGLYLCAGGALAGLAFLPPLTGAIALLFVVMGLLGMGNGSVFQLVPQRFRKEIGVMTGVVGAAGGIGGFFLPNLFGGLKWLTGSYGTGFAAFAGVCVLSMTLLWLLKARWESTFLAVDLAPVDLSFAPTAASQAAETIRQTAETGLAVDAPVAVTDSDCGLKLKLMTHERKRAMLWGLTAAVVLAALLLLGSGNLATFDPALVCYTFAVLFAAFGVTYRFAMWVQRPPTAMYWKRGVQLCLRPAGMARNLWLVLRRFTTDFVFNRFIFRRGRSRGLAHWFIMWGCLIALSVTVPLVFGWIEFRTVPDNLAWYRVYAFGLPQVAFPIESLPGFMLFHVLVWPSLLIVMGVFLAIRRRLRDEGAAALQHFGEDFLPLILLFAVSATGLMLTASYTWMKGQAYEFLAILHAVCVIFTLLWLPFGKLFHVFQRPAHLAVAVYKDAGRCGEQAECRRCGKGFASLMHVQDLITVERQLGYRYEMQQAAIEHYQWICPPCRRALFGLAQGQLWADGLPCFSPGGAAVNSQGRETLEREPLERGPGPSPQSSPPLPRGSRPWLLTAAPPGLKTGGN